MFTQWSDWSECSKTCGNGMQRRDRKCVAHSEAATRLYCEGVLEQSQVLFCIHIKCRIYAPFLYEDIFILYETYNLLWSNNRFVIRTNVHYGQSGVTGQLVPQHVVAEKLKGRENVFCQMDLEAPVSIVRVNQKKKKPATKINAQV